MDTEDEKITKNYELGFLTDDESGLSHIEKTLTGFGATILFRGPINKIELSYKMEKRSSAFFGFVHFSSDPSVIPSLEATLNLDKSVLRFLIMFPIIESKPAYVGKRRTERDVSQPVRPAPEREKEADKQPILSNEALEKTLEEILK